MEEGLGVTCPINFMLGRRRACALMLTMTILTVCPAVQHFLAKVAANGCCCSISNNESQGAVKLGAGTLNIDAACLPAMDGPACKVQV
jgi:hypothetical protein